MRQNRDKLNMLKVGVWVLLYVFVCVRLCTCPIRLHG